MTTISSTISQQLQSYFTAADTDESGTLSLAELKKSKAELPTAQVAGNQNLTAEQLMTKLDTDGDGQLTQTELTQGTQLEQQALSALLEIQNIQSGNLFLSALQNNNGSSSSDSALNLITGQNSSNLGTSLSTLGSSTSSDNTLIANLLGQLNSSTDETQIATISTLLQKMVGSYTAPESTAETALTATTTA